MRAAGDLRAVAAAVVTEAVALTRAVASSMFQMRGGQWARIAVASGTDRSIAVPIGLGDIPAAPLLVTRTASHPHPISKVADNFGIPSFAVVPLHLWPGGPAVLTISAGEEGDIDDADLAVLNELAIIANTAAYHSPLERSEASRALDELGWQQDMLQRIARGDPMFDSLERVCAKVEARFPGAYCSILMADREQGVLWHTAAPSLPPEFCEAINGLAIADGSGACGSAAALLSPVIVMDAWVDDRTTPFRDVATRHNLRSVWSYPLVDSKGVILGTFALYRNTTHKPDADEIATVAALASVAGLAMERFHSEVALTRAAQRDVLTDLANRALFEEMVSVALGRAARTQTACAVMFLDLDGFKIVNDSLGHGAGDRVILEVASRLKAALDRPGVTVARFGADEFTVLVEDTSPTQIETYAQAITDALEEPVLIDGGEFFVTTAIGIVMCGEGTNDADADVDADSVLRDADAAMYAAKMKGRGQRAFYDRGVRERLMARMSLERDLHQAVHDRTIKAHYQPIMDIASASWCGAEALARWTSPRLGDVPPDVFIPLAEEIGVISELGLHVMAQAAQQVRAVSALGMDIPIGVNVSAIQLADPDIAPQILDLLRLAGIGPTSLSLEITESVVMADPDVAVLMLSTLRDAGVRIVIDDFGTGHSSIARLNSLPAAGIKIDKSFTDRLLTDPATVTVVSSVIELAHAFGYTVTAEGVETGSQLHVLRDLGCDQAQGHLFAWPTPPEAFCEVLRTQPLVPGVSR
jgi:diguanylate cyclase (GGDEF)-like protein